MVTDAEGIRFLQWCLPRLHLRWAGFRKVRRQVLKRIDRRMKSLGIPTVEAYSSYLTIHPTEWAVLEAFCHISISRFYRDQRVFEGLAHRVLPDLADDVQQRHESTIRGWSIGCAAGEEPYTLAILWTMALAPRYPTLGLHILATDVDPVALARARRACYPASSLKDLPAGWHAQAFTPTPKGYCLKTGFRLPVTFQHQDVRMEAPDDRFHLILCRYVAFTYFDDTSQRQVLATIRDRLLPGGGLVIGQTETLPESPSGLVPWIPELKIFKKVEEPSPARSLPLAP